MSRKRKRNAKEIEDEPLSPRNAKEISNKVNLIVCKYCKKEFKTIKDCCRHCFKCISAGKDVHHPLLLTFQASYQCKSDHCEENCEGGPNHDLFSIYKGK